MTRTAKGTFEVKLSPQDLDDDMPFARMRIDKSFSGDLDAKSVGQMLAFRSQTDGSAGYVAEEHVSGTLGGKQGNFMLQHASEMNRGQPTQSIRVVPDSGAGDLTGISGATVIDIDADGQHHYTFTYQLDD